MSPKPAQSALLDAKGRPLMVADLETDEERLSAISALERVDGRAIEAELAGTGMYANYFVYAIKVKTKNGEKEVVGMGINGVRWMMQRWHPAGWDPQPVNPGQPICYEFTVEEDHGGKMYTVPYIRVVLKMVSKTNGHVSLGSNETCVWTWYRDQAGILKWKRNPHAMQNALTKAQRKAMEDLLDPAKKISQTWKWHREKKAVLQVGQEAPQKQIVQDNKPKMIQRLFAIADTAGFNTGRNETERDSVIAWAEAKIGKRLSAPTTTEDDVRLAGDALDELLGNPVNEESKANFRVVVLAAKGGAR